MLNPGLLSPGFGPRLTAQYELARRVHGLDDATLARMSVRASAAPADVAARLLAGIDAWLSPGPGQAGEETAMADGTARS